MSKVKVLDNQITIAGNDSLSITETGERLTLRLNNQLIAEVTDDYKILQVKAFLQDHSKFAIISYIESGFVCLIFCLILASMMLSALEKLFNNINQGDTPFTLENVNYIKKIAYLMIIVTILPNVIGAIFEIILQADLGVEFELFSLLEILFLFSIAYIFQYGYEIQLDSKGKMYGNENE